MNDFENRGFFQRNIVSIVVLVAIVVLGFLLFKGWGKAINDGIGGKMETVTGSFTCLPYTGTDTAKADCVLGLKSAEGLYYGLDITSIQDVNTDLKAQDTVAATGFIVVADKISGSNVATTTRWSNYDIKGVIKVNTLLRTR